MMVRRTLRILLVVVLVLTVAASTWLWQNRPVDWSKDKQVTFGIGDSRLVDIKASATGSLVHLAWEDDRDGETEVFYKRSTDNSITWENDVQLSELDAHTIEPAPRLVISGNRVLVFFSDRTSTGEQLFYALSEDEGAHFSTPLQLTADDGDQTNVAVATVGSVVHVVWQSYSRGASAIFYLKSLDAGSTWEEEVPLTRAEALDRHPAIFATPHEVFIVWSRNEEGREAIFFKASSDSGTTWEPEVQLSDFSPMIFPEFPSVGSNGTNVHVVWNEAEVEYARSRNGGDDWEAPIPLTNITRQYLAPEISVLGSHVQVVSPAILTQGRNVSAYMYNLISDDGGDKWQEPLLLSSHNSKLSLAPAISTRPDATFIAWQDNRNGKFAIFLTSKPDFASLRSFESQLLTNVGVVIALTATLFLMLQKKAIVRILQRKSRIAKKRRRIRKSRKRRASTANTKGSARG